MGSDLGLSRVLWMFCLRRPALTAHVKRLYLDDGIIEFYPFPAVGNRPLVIPETPPFFALYCELR